MNCFEIYRNCSIEIPRLTAEVKRLRNSASDLANEPEVNTSKLADVIQILNDRIEKIHDAAAQVDTALDCLENETQKMICFMRYAEGMTVKQIANKLGYTESAIYWHQQNIRKRLQKAHITSEDSV